MIKEVLLGSFSFAIIYFLIFKISKFSRFFDYLISFLFSIFFVIFFYDTFNNPILNVLCVVGPVLFLKLLLDDIFVVSYEIKYYQSMLVHIISFLVFSLGFYALFLFSESIIYYSLFVVGILVCIFYCFYFVFGYRKKDEIDAKTYSREKHHVNQSVESTHIKQKRVYNYSNYSTNQKDNFATLPKTLQDVEKEEENSYDNMHDADMRKLEKEIELKRESVHKDVRSKHGSAK
ncbi:MAG: hypothetical protein WC755_02650 [Candidatus Woesearchaeota archaeon]|jgi:hypothetical protein